MSSVFQVLMNVSREFLSRTGSHAAIIDESEYEYFEYICESMVSLGTFNLKCISGDSTLIPFYLQQVYKFTLFQTVVNLYNLYNLNPWTIVFFVPLFPSDAGIFSTF